MHARCVDGITIRPLANGDAAPVAALFVLVGYVDGDAQPAGIARLVRDGTVGEIAFAVADVHQGRGIGSVLARELAGDARAAGITELRATVSGDNVPVVSLLSRIAQSLQVRWLGGEREFILRLEA
jgi:ribosomal protein S18 acetylase RimI-like enzyme